jgi:hypothetical protein
MFFYAGGKLSTPYLRTVPSTGGEIHVISKIPPPINVTLQSVPAPIGVPRLTIILVSPELIRGSVTPNTVSEPSGFQPLSPSDSSR